MRGVILVFFLIGFVKMGFGQTFNSEGINYTILDPTRVAVALNSSFVGEALIPENVLYNGVVYRVTSIENRAFASCSNLNKVRIPKSVEDIGSFAFGNCLNLLEVIVDWEVPLLISSTVFYRVVPDNLVTLTVPVGATTSYANTAVWKDFKKIQEIILSNQEIDLLSKINLYPSPAAEFVNVDCSGLVAMELEIYDYAGHFIQTQKLPQMENKIDLNRLHSGVYLFKVKTQEGAVVYKIVKQ